MKNITLVGRYNSFSSAYNKARVYFTLSENLESRIKDIYALTQVSGMLSLNQGKPCRCEISELSVKGKRATITFELDVDEEAIENIAKCYFYRVVEIAVSYGDESSMERVNGAFYAKLIKTMERVAAALSMGNLDELLVAIDQVYGYKVLINQNMYQVDAEQLFGLVTTYAQESLPGFEADMPTNDGYIAQRLKTGKCAVCEKPKQNMISGLPLCTKHSSEAESIGIDKIKAKYYL